MLRCEDVKMRKLVGHLRRLFGSFRGDLGFKPASEHDAAMDRLLISIYEQATGDRPERVKFQVEDFGAITSGEISAIGAVDRREAFAKVAERIRAADFFRISGRNGAYGFSMSDDGSLELRRTELNSHARIADA